MNKIITTCLLLLSSLALSPLHAEEEAEEKPTRFYDVEMIFFLNRNQLSPSEQWPVGYHPANTSRAIDLPWNRAWRGFVGLAPETYQLTKEANQIKWSKRYQLLQHIAWRQPGLPENQAIEVRIKAGTPLGPVPQADSISQPIGGNDNQVYPLDGTIKVVLKRYLHLYTNLSYTQEKQLGDNQEGAGPHSYYQSYPVQDHRRMRSREVHYLDHPYVGILVLITPVD